MKHIGMRWQTQSPHWMGLTFPIPYCGTCVGSSTSNLNSIVVKVFSLFALSASCLLSSPACVSNLRCISGKRSSGRPFVLLSVCLFVLLSLYCYREGCYRFLHQPTITDSPRALSGWPTRRLARTYSGEGGTQHWQTGTGPGDRHH